MFIYSFFKFRVYSGPLSTVLLKFSYRPFHLQDLMSNSPYSMPYNSHNASKENLLLDQLIVPLTCLLDFELIF